MSVVEESRASRMWCPFTRQRSLHGDASINRAQDGQLVGRCVGTQCMAWRSLPLAQPMLDPTQPLPPIYERGYCGLAGQP